VRAASGPSSLRPRGRTATPHTRGPPQGLGAKDKYLSASTTKHGDERNTRFVGCPSLAVRRGVARRFSIHLAVAGLVKSTRDEKS
jgi:hypothetical protein